MDNNELYSLIIEKIKAGESKAKIIETLAKEGWRVDDIENTMAQIKSAALRRVPVIAPVLKFFDALEEKHSNISVKAQVGLIAVLCLVLFLVVVVLNMMYNFGTSEESIPVSQAVDQMVEGNFPQ